jgi:hypothetical protein
MHDGVSATPQNEDTIVLVHENFSLKIDEIAGMLVVTWYIS